MSRGADPAFPRRFVVPMLVGAALNPLNSSIIVIALVPIAAAVHVSIAEIGILIAVLYLATAVAQPTAGRLAEELGPRRVFLAGALFVLAGGVVGGLAGDLGTLVVSRVLIGIGTSAGYPTAMLLVRRRADAAGLAAPPAPVLGALSIAGNATAAIGPLVGGVLVALLGWRAAFFVNVPLALSVLLLVLAWIPSDGPLPRLGGPRRFARRIDAVGIVVFAGAMTTMVQFLLSFPDPAWWALAVSGVCWVGLLAWERRAFEPFLDLRLLVAAPALARTYLRNGLSLMLFYSILFGLSQWLQVARGFGPEQAGLLLAPIFATGALVSRPVARRGVVRGPLALGAAAALLGSGLMLALDGASPVWLVVVVIVAFGVSMGCAQAANQTALYQQSRAGRLGTAAGLYRTAGYLGALASAAVTSSVFHGGVTDAAQHTVAIVLLAVSGVVLLLVLADPALRTAAPAEGAREPVPGVLPDGPLVVDSARAAVLVLQGGPGPDLTERVDEVLRLARALHVQVAFVEVAGAAPAATRRTDPTDIVVQRTRVSPFVTTDLDERLRSRGIVTLIVAGGSTSGGVLTAVVDALQRDYRVIVVADATGDPDPEVHEVLTRKVFPLRTHVVAAADLPGLVRSEGGR